MVTARSLDNDDDAEATAVIHGNQPITAHSSSPDFIGVEKVYSYNAATHKFYCQNRENRQASSFWIPFNQPPTDPQAAAAEIQPVHSSGKRTAASLGRRNFRRTTEDSAAEMAVAQTKSGGHDLRRCTDDSAADFTVAAQQATLPNECRSTESPFNQSFDTGSAQNTSPAMRRCTDGGIAAHPTRGSQDSSLRRRCAESCRLQLNLNP